MAHPVDVVRDNDKSSILPMQTDSPDLQFEDIEYDSDRTNQDQTRVLIGQHGNASDEDDKAELLGNERKSPSYWSFEYYQQFFDVETSVVGKRILGSMVPLPRRNFLHTSIRPNPDLYGPFWVCTTLVFSIAIVGNLITVFEPMKVQNFNKVTYAATAIYSYWWFLPCSIFFVLWWRSRLFKYTFTEILSLYGYSISIFVPLSILWVMPWPAIQWTLVALGALLSSSVLLISFVPLLHGDNRQLGLGLLVAIFVCHCGLAVGLHFLSATLETKVNKIINSTTL